MEKKETTFASYFSFLPNGIHNPGELRQSEDGIPKLDEFWHGRVGAKVLNSRASLYALEYGVGNGIRRCRYP
jgi:hypothetical protein